MATGMADHPSKAKENVLYLAFTTNEKKAQCLVGSLWIMKATYSTLGNTALNHLPIIIEDCWLQMEPRTRSSSRLSSGYSVSSPATWAIWYNRKCAIRLINGEKRCHVKFTACLNRGIRMYIPRFVDQDCAGCSGELYTTWKTAPGMLLALVGTKIQSSDQRARSAQHKLVSVRLNKSKGWTCQTTIHCKIEVMHLCLSISRARGYK